MNGLDYKSYFMQPAEAAQRRYEALRCVFVEEQSMKQVAQRYDLSYGTIRNWVSEFSRAQEAGQSPPFRRTIARTSCGRFARDRGSTAHPSRRC